MQKLILYFMLALMISIPVGCAGLKPSLNDPAFRDEIHDFRVELEPLIDEYFLLTRPDGQSDSWERLKEQLDVVATVWDAYLDDPTDENKSELVLMLSLALDLTDAMLPHITGDEEKVLTIRLGIRAIQLAIRRAARNLDEPELEAEATRSMAAFKAVE